MKFIRRKARQVGRAYGDLLVGRCPRCGGQVCSVQEKCACGQRVKFPKATPKLEGVKSVSIEEYGRRRK